jgi:hypothetical protein
VVSPSRKKPPRTPPDAKAVFDHALRFAVADDHLRRSAAGNATLANWVVMPSCVMAVFAAELFLKCIILIEGEAPPDAHHLRKLFDLLSDDAKAQITKMWDHSMFIRRKEFEENERKLQPLMPGIKIPRDLLSALDDCGDTFKKMRYLYEDPNNIKFYIIDFPEILRRYVLKLKPAWKPKWTDPRTQPTSPRR